MYDSSFCVEQQKRRTGKKIRKRTMNSRAGYIIKRIVTFFGTAVCIAALSVLPVCAEEGSASLQEPDKGTEAYWEYVREIQKEIRTRDVGKYGMVPVYGTDVKDGTYRIAAESDSKYFKIAKAELTVEKGEMTARITIPSMSYLLVYMGTAKDAAASKKKEQIGFQEVDNQTVFTVPVEALDKGIQIAAFSKARKKWYDRTVVFDASSLPADALLVDLPDYDLIADAISAYGAEEEEAAKILRPEEETKTEEDPDASPDAVKEGAELLKGEPVAVDVNLPDGEYSIELNMIGGSGRASISSPTWMTVKDGKAYAKLLWSSAHYDYMILGDKTFLNETTDGGNSTFTIPIVQMDDPFPVIADTTAMGDPVEIRYEMTFYSETIGAKGRIPQEAAKKVLIIAAVILVAGFILNLAVKKIRGRKR